jgi:tetratricopeptide (TPR) repeat protein
MMPKYRHLRLAPVTASCLAGLLLLAGPVSLPADALSELPARWQQRLQAVPEADISGVERIGQDSITQTRQRLADRLSTEPADNAELAEGYASLAALYQLFRIDAAAALCWDNARQLQPGEFRWHYYAGYLALTRGQSARALELLEQARTLDPDYPALDLRLGQLWLETNRLPQARAALQRAATTPGLRAAALYYLGQLELLQRDYAAARDHLSEALSLNPEASEVHYPLAQAYRQLGEPALAREHLDKFERREPTADDPLISELEQVLRTSRSDFGQGMRALRERDYQGAIQHFSTGLEIDPDNLAARVSYARVLYLGGQTDAAEQQLHTVLERDPRQPLAQLLLGVLAQARAESGQAAARYRAVLELDPRHDGAHFFFANLLFNQGHYTQAAEHYGSALAVNPDIPPARLLKLVARHRAGQPEQDTAQQLEQLLALHPEQPELKYALIRLRALSADPAVRDSVRALNLANELAPGQPTPANIQALALAAAADGQFDQAARLQQQVVDMLGWMTAAAQSQAIRDTLDAYQEGVMPTQAVWPDDDPLLSPPPLNPVEPFRDYPAPVPF